MAQISIKNIQLTDAVQTTIDNYNIATTSDLINDSNFAVASGTIAHSVKTKSAVQLSGATGVVTDNYGPTTDVSISGSAKQSLNIPQIQVNEFGQVVSATNRTLSIQTY